MHIIDDAAICLSVPPQIAEAASQHIDRCETVAIRGQDREIAFYWGLEETTKISFLLDINNIRDVSIPSPILRDYDWPGVHRPFAHQKATAAFLSVRRRAFCFNQMGTGKTSAAIWAADYLMREKKVRRVLVICPLSIMHSAWKADIFSTAMHRSVAIAHGSAAKRKKIIASDYEFVIINYDGVNIVADQLAKANFDLIIVDEASAYKSASTKRWKTLAKLIQYNTYLWLMTGTPAAQSPMDAFGLAKLVSPDRVPKYMTSWRDKVMYQISRFKWQPKPEAKNEVFNALQPAIRFTKAECLDLPELTYQTRFVEMSAQAAAYYRKLKKEMLIQAAGETISAVNAAASLNKLLQISGGAVYSDTGEVIEFDIAPRLNELKSVLDEAENKVLIFVPYVHTIDLLSEFLAREGKSHEVIRGAVSPKARADIISRFQNSQHPEILVIQPQSASHGVTLTKADTIVFWSPVMSVETYIQCVGRIDRHGQENKMTVVHMQGSSVEAKVYRMLQGKIQTHEMIIDMYKSELDAVDLVEEGI